MKILLHNDIESDLDLSEKKRWHSGLREELPRLFRLLIIDKRLPGQAPVHYLGRDWGGKILHAYIALPRENCGGRNGARIVYVSIDGNFVILYVGGHKDKRYDDGHNLARMLLERVTNLILKEWEEE